MGDHPGLRPDGEQSHHRRRTRAEHRDRRGTPPAAEQRDERYEDAEHHHEDVEDAEGECGGLGVPAQKGRQGRHRGGLGKQQAHDQQRDAPGQDSDPRAADGHLTGDAVFDAIEIVTEFRQVVHGVPPERGDASVPVCDAGHIGVLVLRLRFGTARAGMLQGVSRYDAYIFDVQGTLMDFHTPVTRAVAEALGTYADPATVGDLVRAWRSDYYERVLRLDQSVEKWYRVQDSYVDGLGDVCEQFGIDLPEDVRIETARAWQRLEAWPDVRPGLKELRSQAVVSTLSNTDMATMIRLFREQQLEADAILTAELFGAFKPERFLYERTCRYLGVDPSRAAMVASHPYDLRAAREVGLNTVFVYRPLENGRVEDAVDDTEGEFDHRIEDLQDIP